MEEIPISGLFELLGCPMKIIRSSWSAYSPQLNRALFTVWEDKVFDGNQYYLWRDAEAPDKRFGAKEIREISATVLEHPSIEAYGIRQKRAQHRSKPRTKREWFERGYVHPLTLRRDSAGVLATLGEKIPSISLVKGRLQVPKAAVDDLDIPEGNQTPDRAKGIHSRFIRDSKVRQHVIEAANGRCEYCGREGFLMTNGRRYLEAHHIIALADQGADTIQNVIALCPEHHREAHYGTGAENLETEFITMISRRG